MRKLSRGEGVAVWLAVIVVFAAFLFGNNLFGFFSPQQADVESSLQDQIQSNADVINESDATGTNPSTITPTNPPTTMEHKGLIITDERVGTGAEAVAGKTIVVNYKGTFTDGKQFDSSYDRGEPLSFLLGSGQVIQGWDMGFAGMKVGGKRKIVVPPELGYGPNDYGPIPGNSTLVFEVELLDVK